MRRLRRLRTRTLPRCLTPECPIETTGCTLAAIASEHPVTTNAPPVGLFKVPADGVTPVVLWLVSLRSSFADGKVARAAVVNVVGGNIFIHIVELQLETAFLTGLEIGQSPGRRGW